MKTIPFLNRTLLWVLLAMLPFDIITGKTYQGDLPRSPFAQLLYSLHNFQKANVRSFIRPTGASYSFSYLEQGHIATNANKTNDEVKQEDIWSTKTGPKYRYNTIAKTPVANRQTQSIVSYTSVLTMPEQLPSMVTFASIMEISASKAQPQTETSSDISGIFTGYVFGKPESTTQVLFADGWDDPGDPTVPVGDGVYCFAICLLIYMAIKRKTLFSLIFKQSSLNL